MFQVKYTQDSISNVCIQTYTPPVKFWLYVLVLLRCAFHGWTLSTECSSTAYASLRQVFQCQTVH